ncbi:MAG: hypothetical protein SWY16_11475 [Cyanobacteriota bacterium]|nr:hypothetical protein [Cyanobacteriota bacterium]
MGRTSGPNALNLGFSKPTFKHNLDGDVRGEGEMGGRGDAERGETEAGGETGETEAGGETGETGELRYR